jgi:hypothetical protein
MEGFSRELLFIIAFLCLARTRAFPEAKQSPFQSPVPAGPLSANRGDEKLTLPYKPRKETYFDRGESDLCKGEINGAR